MAEIASENSKSALATLAGLAGSVRIPTNVDKVHKDECLFSFDTPDSDDGLYVCLNRFLGFGRRFVERYHRKTGSRIFLRIKRIRVKMTDEDGDGGFSSGVPEKVSRMAIGVEGGFNPDSGAKKI